MAGAAALIAVLTVLSRVAGFGRSVVFTNTVGADSTGDTYLAANNVPNIVFEVVAGGALASLVVPMLAGGIAAGNREQVRQTASALLGWTLLVLTPLAVALAVAARPIAGALLGDDAADPGKVDLAARFLLVFAPQVVLYGIGIVLTGVLQAHRRFAGPALAPLLSSVVVAGAYLTFAGIGGGRQVGDLSRPAELVLGVGTTLGVVALAGCLLVPMRGLRLGLRPRLRFPVGVAPRVRRLAVAGVLTLAGQQLVAVVAIRLANAGTVPAGTQVVYFAGMTLFLLPWAALAVPLATSAYPGLTERAAVGDAEGFRRALAPVVVLVVALSAVAAAGLVAVSGPMARVYLASPADAASAALLAPTIVAFVPGLLGYGLVAVLTRALYARGSWRAPTVCVAGGWLVAVAADLGLAALLPAGDRAVALALGHTAGVTVAGVGLLVVVGRSAGRGALAGLPRVAVVSVAAAVLGGAAGWAVSRALGSDPVPTGGVLAAVGTGVVAGVRRPRGGGGGHDGTGTSTAAGRRGRPAGHGGPATGSSAADARREPRRRRPGERSTPGGATGRPGAGHQHRGSRHPRPLAAARPAARRRLDPGLRAGRHRRALRLLRHRCGLPPGADLGGPRRSPRGPGAGPGHGRRRPGARPRAARRAGGRPRPPAGRGRPGRAGADPAQRPAARRWSAAGAAGPGGGSHHPGRGPGAGRLGRPGRERLAGRCPRRPARPGLGTAAAAGDPAPGRGPRRPRAATRTGRWSWPWAGCTRRRATARCWTPWPAGPTDRRW